MPAKVKGLMTHGFWRRSVKKHTAEKSTRSHLLLGMVCPSKSKMRHPFCFLVTAVVCSAAIICCFQGSSLSWWKNTTTIHNNPRRLLSWRSAPDPKTVTLKARSKAQQLRFVAFGTSKTWGTGLKNPEHETYIKLLSPTSLNLGLRATPADYPSFCLHSMIGDKIFDVIILEFSPYHGPPYDDFVRLIKRIRARFPSSIIIFLPLYMILYDVSYQGKDLFQYIRQQRLVSSRTPEFTALIHNLNETELSYPDKSYATDKYRETVDSVGGYILEFPSFHGDIKDFILWNIKFFGSDDTPWDFVHPSALGHQVIAEQIRHLVQDVVKNRPLQTTDVGVWAGGEDRCTSWYSDANLTDDIKYVTDMNLVNFNSGLPWEPGTKWALEVDRRGGSFTVLCHFPHCNIYLSYMAKGPAREYPRVLVSLGDKEPKLVDPYIGNFHLRQLAFVGTADFNGLTTVVVKPIPEDMDSPLGFRITGVVTTPTAH